MPDQCQIPPWAFRADGVSVHPARVLGPMIPSLRIVSYMNSLAQIIALVMFRSMPQGRGPLWVALLPALSMKMYAERRCVMMLVVPYAAQVCKADIDPFYLFGLGSVRFPTWFFVSAVCSFLLS